MSHPRTPNTSILARGIAVSLGLLLVPLTLTPAGVEENLACGSEGPDNSNCVRFLSAMCLDDGEYVQNRRMVE
ncbi:MAG: hypothetical protein V3S56_10560 [Gemmatimonadota bacterium]